MPDLSPNAEPSRLQQIALARRTVMVERRPATDVLAGGWDQRGWIERSWQRCLTSGRQPQERLGFDIVASQALRRVQDAQQPLLAAARPVMQRLARAIAHSRYFAILTDAQGVVVAVDGPIDRSDRRAHLITRIGVDLSERAVGTTAIGAVLAERQPVWLHRSEHFFDDTGCYSCAGAPVFGPDGSCAGMLDLTGIDAPERPELMHLASHSARSIENALVATLPHALLRLAWPGLDFGEDQDGLVALDTDGCIRGANRAAREMLAQPVLAGTHCSDLFASPWQALFDAVRHDAPSEVPLWSGLTLQVLAQPPGVPLQPRRAAPAPGLPLKDFEAGLIRQAVQDARGNVAAAARALGISRATVYRKLGQRGR